MKQIKNLKLSYLFSFIVALLLGVLPTSCKDNDDQYEKIELEVSVKDLSFAKDGGTETFVVKSNRPWSVEVAGDWLTVSPTSGDKGTTTVNVKTTKNASIARAAKLVVMAGKGAGAIKKYIEIKQAGDGKVVPSGSMTIKDFLSKYQKGVKEADATVIEESAKLVATVISDNSEKNFHPPYKIYVQDKESGIILILPKGVSVNVGDILDIDIKGGKYGKYVDKQSGKEKDEQLTLASKESLKVIGNKKVEPKEITLAEAYSGKYQNVLVKVTGIQFSFPGKKFSEGQYPFFRVEDTKTKAPEGYKPLSVFVNKGFATFKDEVITDKSGSVVGILTSNKPFYNLLVRYFSDIQMTNARLVGGTEVTPEDPKEKPEEPKPTPEDPKDKPETGGTTAEGTVIFLEEFGTPVKGKKYWPNVDKYTGWTVNTNTYTDPLLSGKYSNASVRKTSTMNGHVWFAGKKTSALKIEGFATGKGLKLTFKFADNSSKLNLNQLILKTNLGDITLPDMPMKKNKFQEVTVDLQDDITFIQFEARELEDGVRLDDVKLVKTK